MVKIRRSTSSSSKPRTVQKKTSTSVLLLCIAGVFLFLAAVYFWPTSNRDREAESGNPEEAAQPLDPPTASPPIVALAEERFDASCSECHSEIVESYSRSGMSHSWQPASRLAGVISNDADVTDPKSGYHYQIIQKDGDLVQVETCPEFPDASLSRTAQYVVGSGKHAQAMITNENGFHNQMPIAWYSGRHEWGLNPGFELRNQRFDRPIVPGCVACHTTSAVHESASKNRFTGAIASGIHCRRCHGDAASHVSYWRDHPDGKPIAEAVMIDPASFSNSQSNDLCLQCHLQGDVSVFLNGSTPLSYRPGQKLLDQRHDFLLAGSDPKRLGVASHGARMLQSKCYTASEGKLTCVLCHDPHVSANEVPRHYYDSRCNVCHAANDCNRPLASENLKVSNDEQDSCTRCHMPQRSSREGIHLVFTDHAIVRTATGNSSPEPQINLLAPNSNPVLIGCWPEHVPARDIEGAAYQLLHETMGPQEQSISKAIALLSPFPHAGKANIDIRFWLGSAFLSNKQPREAIAQFVELLKSQPHHHLARFRLALAYEQMSNLTQAINILERLIKEAPSLLDAYNRLAQIYISQQQYALATRVLRERIAMQDDAQSLAMLALSHRFAGGLAGESTRLINRAIQLDPKLPQARLHKAIMLLMDGSNDAAKLELELVLRLDPNNANARQALEQMSRQK